MPIPSWTPDAIFYQIFPDRFLDGDRQNNPKNVQPWGAQPTVWGFQGGDLRGIIRGLDYLVDLGVNSVYLNPIFQASSNHRYNTSDYYHIDPKLGNKKDFDELLRIAHDHNIKVILDGVFNHCGRGFFAFYDVLENQEHSTYKDWFHIKRFPLDAYSPGPAKDYLAWWEIKSLPKFNTSNPDVRKYLLGVARYWIEQGADGWRLDVPQEIDDDTFWEEFRETVKGVNPEAYLVGEIWKVDQRWVGENHFDGLLNYPLRDLLIRFLYASTLTVSQFAQHYMDLYNEYPFDNMLAMYNPLGSHDTERIFTKLGGDWERVRLALTLQFALPGAPGIYYGDEIGLPGDKDPDCRRAFPWDRERWNHSIRDWVKILIAARKGSSALRRGDLKFVWMDDKRSCFALERQTEEQRVLVLINASPVSQDITLSADLTGWTNGQTLRDLLTGEIFPFADEKIIARLKPMSGAWLCNSMSTFA